MSHELPQLRPVGIVRGDAAPPEMVRLQQLRISRAPSLAELVKDYAFYSPALIYLCNQLTFDPLSHFQAEDDNAGIVPFSLRLAQPVFQGMNYHGGDLEWNYVLFGVAREHWTKLLYFFGSLAFTDRVTRQLTRIRPQTVRIADPFILERSCVLPDPCPLVEITVFGLDTNRGCRYIQEARQPPVDLPFVTNTVKSYRDTRAFAEAIFNHQPRPYEAVDQVFKEEQRGAGD